MVSGMRKADRCRVFAAVFRPQTKKGGQPMTKSSWGGPRPHSGRKPSPVKRKQLTIYVLPEVADKLKAIAKARKTMVGRIIEELLKD